MTCTPIYMGASYVLLCPFYIRWSLIYRVSYVLLWIHLTYDTLYIRDHLMYKSKSRGKYISVCKACGKLGVSGGMLPQEILILDLLFDANWWNLKLLS